MAAPFTHTVRVRWGHCDPARIAYTANLPALALEAIDAWWEDATGLDWFAMNIDRGFGAPFVHLEMDFRAPVTPRAPLVMTVRLLKLGETSVRLRVEGSQDGRLCFTGEFVEVIVPAEHLARMPIPADVREKLEARLEPAQA